MSYIGLLNFPWDSILKIFGSTWRPLSNFRFCLYGLFEKGSEGNCIDETTLLQIRELDTQSISIEIIDASFGVDLLKFSRRWLDSPDGLHLLDFLHDNFI